MRNDCPRCGDQLTNQAFGTISVDGCQGCGGLWFDYNELNGLVRDRQAGLMAVERAFNPALFSRSSGGEMKCPKCPDSSLYRFSFPHTPNVDLDACPTCKGIWVDDGELQKIAERLGTTQSTQIPLATGASQPLNREQIRTVTSFLLS